MKNFRTGLLAVLLVLMAGASAFAQTSLNSTTFSVAVAAGDTAVTVASASNISVGDLIFANREAMRVTSIASTRMQVVRGAGGTTVNAHPASAVVYTGVPARFYASVPVGSTCSRATERFVPHIVLPGGDIWDCFTGANAWVLLNSPNAVSVTCRALLIADMVDQSCFTADRAFVVTKITEVHKVAEAGGTLTLIPRRQTGTQAAASGDALATAIDMVTTGNAAQTVKTATLATNKALLILAPGDRLGLDFTDDTAGELADVLVTFTLVPR